MSVGDVEKKMLNFYNVQLSLSHEEYCTGLMQTKRSVWSQMLSQYICNSIHQRREAFSLILKGITTGCRKGLKYLCVIWGQMGIHTLSLTHTYKCTL